VGTTIIKRSDRAITVAHDDAAVGSCEPARVARGSDAMRLADVTADRPTRAMHKDELLGLIKDTGGFDPEIEIVATPKPEPEPKPQVAAPQPAARSRVVEPPAAMIVDLPPQELVQHARPTCAIDPDELRALVRPAVLPVYRSGHARWPLIAAVCAAAIAVILLIG